MENDILTRARTMVSRLSQQHHVQSSSRTPQVVKNQNQNQHQNQQECPEALMTASAAIVVELRLAIQETVVSEDSERMARLLNVNDELLELMMRRIPSLSRASDASSGIDGGGGDSERQRVVLQGLGLSFDGSAMTLESKGEKHEGDVDVAREPDDTVVVVPDLPDLVVDHHLVSDGGEGQGHDEGSLVPTLPRVDKGKGRAEPAEEEKHEMMTSLSYAHNSDSEEDEERRMTNSEMSTFSPTER